MPNETICQLVSLAPWTLAIIAFGGFIFQISVHKRKWDSDESRFRLTSALDAFAEAHKLLKDGNNDRITWISAARALKRGKNIAKDITEKVDKDVLEVQLDRYRIIFSQILGADDLKKGIEFFKGELLPEGPYSAFQSSAKEKDRYLPPPTLKVIWDFAQFPEGYDDPIHFKESFSNEEIDQGKNNVIWPALFEYLKFCRRS
ncbi:MAG: hypothetical protein VW455_09845 [Nitrospinota bacterium]